MSTAEVRIGDAERGAAAAAIGDHFAAGRLERAEFDDRMERALVARTGADLEVLFTDLPRTGWQPQRPAERRPAPRLDGLRGRHGPHVPLLPLLLVLVAVVLATGIPVWLVIVGWFLLARSCWHRRRFHPHYHGGSR